jgi:uncharacterized protein YndB with AHSA1/START domain
MNQPTTWSEAKCAHYEFSLEIEAPPQRVWRALADQIGSWWLPHFHMLGEDSIVEFEPKAGGRLFERQGDRELLWYTVISIDAGKSIDLAGYCSAKFGGPATTMLAIELSEVSGSATKLTVADSLYGRVTEGFVQSLNSGWQELFRDGLQAFVAKN